MARLRTIGRLVWLEILTTVVYWVWVPVFGLLPLIRGRIVSDYEFTALDLDTAMLSWIMPMLASVIVAPQAWGRAARGNDPSEFVLTRGVAKGDCFWAKMVVLCGVSATLILPQIGAAVRQPDLVVTAHWHDHGRYLAGMSGSTLVEGEDLAREQRNDGYVEVAIPSGRIRGLAFAAWLLVLGVAFSQWAVLLAVRRGWIILLAVLGLLIPVFVPGGLDVMQRLEEGALFFFDRYRILGLALLAVAAPLLLLAGRRRFEQMEVL